MSEKNESEEVGDEKRNEDANDGSKGLEKLLKDLGIIGASKIVSMISSLLLIPILTKTLGPYNYGLWAQVTVTLPLFAIILEMGVPFSIARLFPARDEKERGRDLSSVLVVVTLALGIFGAILLLFPSILADTVFDGHILIVQIVVFLVIAHCFNGLFLSVFRALREMKTLGIINIVRRLSELGIMGSIALLGYGLIGVLGGALFSYTIFVFILLYMVRDRIKLRKPKIGPMKEYFSLSIPTMPAGVSELIVIMSDRYLVGIFLGATYVGYYAPAYALGETAPKFVTGMLALVLFPTLSKHFEDGNTSQVKHIIHLCTKYFVLFSLPLIIGFTIIGRSLLSAFTTPEIASNAYIILILSSIVGLLMGLETIFRQTIGLKKDTKLIGIMWTIAAVLNVGANIVLIPEYGILAAGLTSIAAYLVVALFAIFYTMKHMYVPIDFVVIGKIVLSAGFMGATLLLVNVYIWQNLLFSIVIGVVSYFLYLYVTNALTADEIRFIKNTFVP